MARHRSAGPSSRTAYRPRQRSSEELPRRAARARARARRRAGGRGRRSQHTSLPVRQRLLALPWVTFVLLALVAAAVVGVLRPTVFEARSTVTAATPGAAASAAVWLTDPDLAREVERQVELAPDLRRSVLLSVERPAPRSVVVRAEAPDPRLAAVAADTAAALATEAVDGLGVTEAAVVPTGPVGGGSWWPWALAGGALLALAALVERRRDLRGDADEELRDTATTDVPGATPAPVAPPGVPTVAATGAPTSGRRPVPTGGAR